MRRIFRPLACFLALTINTAGASATATNAKLVSTETPEGFRELETARTVFLDVYFGDRKIAETVAVARPGVLQFRAPNAILASLPNVIAAPEIVAALSGALDSHSEAACSRSNLGDCGTIRPDVLGIVYDEEHFRVDLFVHPRFLRHELRADTYLPVPSAPLSLTNAVGLNASGTLGGRSLYNLQNRTIIGLHNGRIRANTSVASRVGVLVDDLVAEMDTRDRRYSAGMFWTPGNEFVGQRRIIGAGFGTQFDTWADQNQLHGTPLIVSLSHPSRVEVLADGRLVSSRSYAAGNVEIDTSELPEGSYSVLLRIRQPNGAVHEERRFFVKNSQVPPDGHPIFYAYGGVLANTRPHQPIHASGTLYYQVGTARRLSNNFALDVAALGTQHKAIIQAGGWLIKGPARVRAAGLYSSAGDWGALVQATTAGGGPLNISFDLRRIWSRDGKPLIPLPIYANSFDLNPPTGLQLALGSYTQATASVGVQLGRGHLAVVGSYRKDQHREADYMIGPSVSWPIVTRNRVQILFEGSAQLTRNTTAAFGGFRLLFNSGRLSMMSTIGHGFENDQGEHSRSRGVSTLSAQYSYRTDGSDLQLAGGVDRNISSSTMHAAGTLENRFGTVRGDLLHNLQGSGGTQFDIAVQSGLVLGGKAAEVGARNLEQSAIVVSLTGDSTAPAFRVLVNDVARGQVRNGRRLLLFVPPYRTYDVRLVPVAAAPVDYDLASRKVTLYPGNVQTLSWNARSYFTVFGQAVSRTGRPIGDALVQSGKGIAETDSNGYFQVDVAHDDPITIAKGDDTSCRIRIGNVAVRNDFASLGRVVCE